MAVVIISIIAYGGILVIIFYKKTKVILAYDNKEEDQKLTALQKPDFSGKENYNWFIDSEYKNSFKRVPFFTKEFYVFGKEKVVNDIGGRIKTNENIEAFNTHKD